MIEIRDYKNIECIGILGGLLTAVWDETRKLLTISGEWKEFDALPIKFAQLELRKSTRRRTFLCELEDLYELNNFQALDVPMDYWNKEFYFLFRNSLCIIKVE